MSGYMPGGEGGRRAGPPGGPGFGMGIGGGGPVARNGANAYRMPQYPQGGDSYGGPPQSPVMGGWEGRYVQGLYEGVDVRPDQQAAHQAGTPPLGPTNPGAGEGAFMLSPSGGGMGAAGVQNYYAAGGGSSAHMYGVGTVPYNIQGSYMPYGGGAGSASAYYGAAQDSYGRSTNPGQPIQTTNSLQGPEGCNLFVFHIPNTMTNEALFRLFSKFGTVISARIMVEKATGRSRGFGFVSYDNRDSAENAINQMNGYQIEHKRLKVQHKKEKDRGYINPREAHMHPRAGGRGYATPYRQVSHQMPSSVRRHPQAMGPQHMAGGVDSRHHDLQQSALPSGMPPPTGGGAGGGDGLVGEHGDVKAGKAQAPEPGSVPVSAAAYLVDGGTTAPASSASSVAATGTASYAGHDNAPSSSVGGSGPATPDKANLNKAEDALLAEALQNKLTLAPAAGAGEWNGAGPGASASVGDGSALSGWDVTPQTTAAAAVAESAT